MDKMWKIGTSIGTYIREIKQYQQQYGSNFHVKKNSNKMDLIFPSNIIKTKTKSTGSQFMRVLISLGIIKNDSIQYRYDKSVLQDADYNIITWSNDEELNDILAHNVKERVDKIYNNNNTLFPSEKSFIFSLMSVVFSIKNKENIKYLNLRTHSTVDSIMKYYSEVANWILNSPLANDLLEHTSEHIIGFTENVSQIIKSINNNAVPSANICSEYDNLVQTESELKPEALTFGKFLSILNEKTHMEIPIYQRKYIWPKFTVITLLNDIFAIKDTIKNQTHYIGNLIYAVKRHGNIQIYRLIDGQQRITTLILVARALYDFAKFKKYKMDRLINGKFSMFDNNDSDIIMNFKRIEGNNDYDAFKAVMRGESFKTDIKKTYPSIIIENYKEILNWMSITFKSEKEVIKFTQNLLNGINFIWILTTSDEYKLFEKLNTGAVPLTTLELFKNYILDKFNEETTRSTDDSKNEKSNQQLYEKTISSKFVGRNHDSAATKFIISYLRTNNSVISNETIFNQFKDLIEEKYILNHTDYELPDILHAIAKEINLYNTISKYHLYTKKESYTYLYSDFLYMFDGRTVYFPLIIKLIKIVFLDYVSPTINEINTFRKYLRVIEIFEVRLQVANYRGQSLSSKIENILMEIHDDITPSELWTLFQGNNSTGIPTVDELRSALSDRPIQNKPARLIMTRIENYFMMNEGWSVDEKDHIFVGIYEKPSHREHLLPNQWHTHWLNHLSKLPNNSGMELKLWVMKYIDYIGNAFAIPGWSNIKAKNLDLDSKLKAFNNSSYSKNIIIFKGIPNKLDKISDMFGPDEILERSKQIGNIAKIIWQDYDGE